MRPIKLTMTAFGPYAGTEVVDFRNAIASGLFGIYGSTGAGKSTIFSAMMFALFGKLSRAEQDMQSVRSDHAAPQLLTQVEFIFEVCEKRYLIRRIPDQSRPKRSGGGETKETHKAWIFNVSDINVDDISESNSGQCLVEKKVNPVQQIIIGLLGYGPEQFRQIVLLPQGRFETFLIAKTDDRKKILRELFDVSLYLKLANSLKDKAAEAVKKVNNERRICADRLALEGFESPDALVDGIAKAEKKVEIAGEEDKKAKLAEKKAQKAKTDGEQIDRDFENHAIASNQLNSLTAKSAQIAKQENRLKSLYAAKALMDTESHNLSAANDVQQAKEVLKTANEALDFVQNEKEQADKNLKTQKSLEAQRIKERENSEALKRHRVTLKHAQSFLSDWKAKRAIFETVKSAHETSEENFAKIVGMFEKAGEAKECAQQNLIQRNALDTKIAKAEQSEAAAKNYEEAQLSIDKIGPKIAAQKAAVTTSDNTLNKAEINFSQAEQNLSIAQAQHLASKLKDGDPCSVCGSREHPSPAKGTAESAGLDQALRDARETLETARKEHDSQARSLATLESQRADKVKAFKALFPPALSYKDSKLALTKLRSDLDALGPKPNMDILNNNIEKYSQLQARAKEDAENTKSKLETANIQMQLAKQRYDEALTEIPEPLRDPIKLEFAFSEANEKYETSIKTFENARERSRAINEELATRNAEQVAANERVKETNTKLANAQAQFAERLAVSGMTKAVYLKNKAEIENIETLEGDITRHKEELAIVKDRVQQAAEKIRDKARPDVESLIATAELAEHDAKSSAFEYAQSVSRCNGLKTLQASLAAEIKKINKVESDTACLRELAALFSGSNSGKIDLETFAIGAMFDQVLQAANLRLGPMTNGRYSFERALEGKGNAKRGLDINVYDVHSGKARPTTSLSGGETFQAALSLALGLSDVVESTNGSVKLDAIFIDEGFGTLDANTLDQVLQTLQDLIGEHRAIGLISHVDLVKRAIPNGFSIRKTPSGSYVETRKY